jgi:small-conductance mechanosensitive channel
MPLAICGIVMAWLTAVPVFAEPSGSGSAVPVRLHGETLFTLQTGLANVDTASRAAAIEKRLARLAQASPDVIESLRVEDHEQTSYVVTSEEVLFVVTENEAKAAEKPRQLLAEEQAHKIRDALRTLSPVQSVPEPAAPTILRELLWAGVASALLIFIAVALRVLFPRLYELFEAWRGTRLRAVSLGGLELISADQLTNGLLVLSRTLRLVIGVLALYLYIHFILGMFPWTRHLERTLWTALATPLEQSEVLRANLAAFFIGLVLTVLATGVFLALYKLVQQLGLKLLDTVESWGNTKLPSFKVQRVELLSAAQITEGLLSIIRVIRILAMAILVYFYATSVLGLFPWTRDFSVELLGYVATPITRIAGTFAAALPDLIGIGVIVLVTRYILKLFAIFFRGLERGAISFTGFHRDWARPTYGIVRFLVIVFAAIACFPYIPGSQSEGFRGISVFLGLLISLGSAAAIGNMIAGVVLTYMRPFQLGDRVKIADTVGDVAEKTLLVTRIRTIKNVDITIPNSLILAAHIVNYSSTSLSSPPLILNTAVTIGYDAPWRTVHELLKKAAASTRNILADPEPFVLQTALNDFYVTSLVSG